MLPIDLVLVRHGQSEGNVARRRSRAGDHSAFSPEFRDRHSASFRLTEEGRKQAGLAGLFVRTHLWGSTGFDRCLVSEYARAKETAGLMQLPNAMWYCDPYLSERDWGELDNRPENEREEQFGEAMRQRKGEPFFWRPPNGESIAEMCLRIDRVLHTLHRECGDKRVIIVCHGEVMRGFKLRIERTSQAQFKKALLEKCPSEHTIYNGEIWHYTRRDPETGRLTPHIGWWRRFRPTDPATSSTLAAWREIKRPKFSNEDLLAQVSEIPVMVPC